MAKTTLVVIAYELDYRMLILQAISVYRNFDYAQISDYIIINNGNCANNDMLQKYFERVFPYIFFKKMKFINSADILSYEEYEKSSGQRTQQILKLRVSSIIDTESYIILDAKNFFIRKSNLNLFIDVDDGKYFTTFSNNISEYWIPYISNSFLEFNLQIDINECYKMPTITPYVMNTKLVKDLVSVLESNYDGNISRVFEKYHGKVTEFFLYFAYLLKVNQVDFLYKNSRPSCITFFAQYPSEYGVVDKYMKEIDENENIYLIGLHKNRLSQLSQEHFCLLENICYRSLLLSWERLDWFLDSKKQNII